MKKILGYIMMLSLLVAAGCAKTDRNEPNNCSGSVTLAGGDDVAAEALSDGQVHLFVFSLMGDDPQNMDQYTLYREFVSEGYTAPFDMQLPGGCYCVIAAVMNGSDGFQIEAPWGARPEEVKFMLSDPSVASDLLLSEAEIFDLSGLPESVSLEVKRVVGRTVLRITHDAGSTDQVKMNVALSGVPRSITLLGECSEVESDVSWTTEAVYNADSLAYVAVFTAFPNKEEQPAYSYQAAVGSGTEEALYTITADGKPFVENKIWNTAVALNYLRGVAIVTDVSQTGWQTETGGDIYPDPMP